MAVKFFDDAEYVVPSSGIEPGDMIAELVQNFLHFKSAKDGLNQDRHFRAPTRNPQRILHLVECIVPQSRLKMAFQFGQIEVWSRASLQQRSCVVKEVQAGIE